MNLFKKIEKLKKFLQNRMFKFFMSLKFELSNLILSLNFWR